MKRFFVIFNLLIFTIFCSCSEDTIGVDLTGSVTGVVKDAESNLPLENVKITTSPASTTVFTDENGEFIIENIAVDDYSVKAESEGYVTGFEAVSVIEDNLSNVAFELKKSSVNNKQPSTPQLIAPEDQAGNLDLSVNFIWQSSDPENDELNYELEIKNDRNNNVLRFPEIQDTTYTVTDLQYGYKYFWQIKVSDSINDPVFSEVFSFNTLPAPANNNYIFTREINGNNVIFSSDTDGNEVQITSSGNNSFRPRKNLNVNKIAFYRTISGATHLFTMSPDGTDQKQITNSIPANGIDNERLGLSWADNGRYLLYPNFDKVYKINADGSGKEIIYQAPSGRYVLDIQQTDDRTEVLILETNLEGYDGSLFTIDSNGNKSYVIVENATGALGGIDISVDNNLVLFTRDVSGYENPGNRQLNAKMFIYRIDTDTTIDISTEKPNGTNDIDPRFAPNEASVIFVNESNEAGSIKSIYKVIYDEDFDTLEQDRELLIENAKMPDWE